jgi:hypothetical protein
VHNPGVSAGASIPSVERTIALLSALPAVEAIALGGSCASGVADADSDVDL